MTERAKNPLLAASQEYLVGKFAVGTPQALTQLHDHCATLNAKSWVVASGRPFIVRMNADKKQHEIVRRGEVSEQPDVRAVSWAEAA